MATESAKKSFKELVFKHKELLLFHIDDDGIIPQFLESQDVNHIVDAPNPKVAPGDDPRLENLALLFSLCYDYVRDETLSEELLPGSDNFWAQIARDFHDETHDDNLLPPKHMKKTMPLCVVLLSGRRRWLKKYEGSIKSGEMNTVPATKWETMMHLFGLACKRRYLLGLSMSPRKNLRYEFEGSVSTIEEEIRKCTENLKAFS